MVLFIKMSRHVKLVRTYYMGLPSSRSWCFGKFLKERHVERVGGQREFHISHLSAVFARELFVGNFVKVNCLLVKPYGG